MKKISFAIVTVFLFFSCKVVSFTEKELFPGAGKPSANPVDTEVSYLNINGEQLETWTYQQDSPEVFIIFFPGNGGLTSGHAGFFKDIARIYKAKVTTVNYRGYGRSSGKPSVSAIEKDSTSVVRKLSRLPQNSGLPLIIMAHSLGGFAATRVAGLSEVSGLFFISTFTTSQELAGYWRKSLVPWYARPFIRIDAEPVVLTLDNISVIKEIYKPIVFIHGKKDDVIPYSMAESLYRACPSVLKKLVFLEQADHTSLISNPEHRKFLIKSLSFLMDYKTR
ncbi:alpha/beta fold hydrolase [Spirochaetia bacterium 38H-sp]|uniref:Alpha/beta fold hydrolase n=1 Tax=Rarispira pelagica TaxID=3141764 RepID=A0ABU9U9J0_9SPIR